MLREARDRVGIEPLPREPEYYGAMYARYLVDTEAWAEAEEWLPPEAAGVDIAHYYFARALSAAKRNKLDEARALAAKMHPGAEANPEIVLAQEEVEILQLQVEAAIALAKGEGQAAIDAARRAAEIQASMPFRYGPPRISKPTAELLGDILAATGDYEQAILAYEDELTRSQLRTNSLLGLARARAKAGDDAGAREAYRKLLEIWDSADPTLGPLKEARRGAEAH